MTAVRCVASIHLSALRHNLSILQQKLQPDTKTLAMVKADAYGHGMLQVAKILSPMVSGFGVATIEEGIHLRASGVDTPIVVMNGFFSPGQLSQHIEYRLTPVIHEMQQIDWLAEAKITVPISVWLQVDSGMRRLGFLPNSFHHAWQRLRDITTANVVTVMTHFADADTRDSSQTKAQNTCFDRIAGELACEKSLCNSAALLSMLSVQADWVRPGIAIYGASPFLDQLGSDFGLQPVMTLTAPVISVKHCRKGDRIGYNGTYVCEHDMSIAIVGIGYGDGYPRHITPNTPVSIHGTYCSIVGRVSMDMLAVDLSPLETLPSLNDRVILWGEGLPIERIAKHAGAIPYELFCQLTDRVALRFD